MCSLALNRRNSGFRTGPNGTRAPNLGAALAAVNGRSPVAAEQSAEAGPTAERDAPSPPACGASRAHF